MAINCLRAIPKIPHSSNPKITSSFSNSFLFSSNSKPKRVFSSIRASMSYEKELAAAKKAASVAARLCQALLSLSLFQPFLLRN
ncbi:hypothetical protein RchiOBHm_Chr2g0121711 [Rosa chinensis]|uniref:Uncharacterized protein n=1 Tax=Rosa chinensis TaxID=74649 RepID=A0A2P6RSL3_ROSCH|nr:hypothetical protein RchiOBHm_Chr2g0121711 [Rosa chinensis]